MVEEGIEHGGGGGSSAKGYDFTNYSKSFRFGGRDSSAAVSLDLSLANLFQKLTVECRGVLGNPQWKHYRHMQLLKNDQIRLSNGIWRSWHIQFQKGRKPKFCKFVVDPDQDMASHKIPQGVVIEGKYWKRTRQAVANEYRKWRLFHKKSNVEWSKIKRVPAGGSNLQQQEGQGGGDHVMQVDLNNTANRFNSSLIQGLEDFPDLFMNIVPRPGEERAYMRPLVDAAEMLQPNLDMLNPMLDDFLDRLEPMEVMFPSFNGSGMRAGSVPPFSNVPQAQAPPTVHTPTQQGLSPNNMYMMAGGDGVGQYENQSELQYGNPMSFLTPPSKMMGTIQEENEGTGGQSYQTMRGGPYAIGPGPPSVSDQTYHMSPSAYLNTPGGTQEVRLRTGSESMDLGSASSTYPHLKDHTHSSTHSLNQGKPYQQQKQPMATPLFTTEETSPPIMYLQPDGSRPHPPTPGPAHQSAKHQSIMQLYSNYPQSSLYMQHGDSSFQATPTQTPQPYPIGEGMPGRGVSTNSGHAYPKQGGVDQDMQFIAEQMKRLEEQQLEQIREIEKQQSIATQQYLQLLQQYVSESGEQPTQQQQRDLAAVLSNPASVQILKSILTHDKVPSAATPSQTTPPSNMTPPLIVKQELVSPQQSSLDLQAMAAAAGDSFSLPSPSISTSPSQIVKESGVSDFQSRLLMAAAAQACTPITPSYSVQSSSDAAGFRTKSPDLHDTSSGVSPALLKKFKNARNLTPDEKKVYQELRRQSHITAEQKRRGSIKNGFEQLQNLVINPNQHPSGKVSKAVLLEKTIEYLQRKHSERDAREKRIEQLKGEILRLNQSITTCQQQLPASGVLVPTRQRYEENKQLFKDYVQHRTSQNYKFWIFSIILQHLFDSYNGSVSTASTEVLCQSVLSWSDQNCSLPALRPIVMSSLKELSIKTSILSDPSKLPEQLTQYAATEGEGVGSNGVPSNSSYPGKR